MDAIRVSDGGYINGVGIHRVNDDSVDVPRILQAHSFPCLARIEAFEDAFADVHGVPWVSFPGADPHNIGVGLLNGDGAYILCGLVIEDGCPGIAAVLRFPDTTRCGAEINDVGIRQVDIDGGDAATHAGWADITWLEIFELFEIDLLCGCDHADDDTADAQRNSFSHVA